MITTVIFDLSEVYLHGLLGIEAPLQVKHGITFENTQWQTNELEKLFHGEITEEVFLQSMIDKFQWDVTLLELKAVIRHNFREIPGTREIIEALKKSGYKLGLLSVHAREWIEYCEKRFDYHRLFDSVIYSFQIAICKPEKSAYEMILAKLHVQPKECVFIDDSVRNLRTAESLGMTTILFKTARQLGKDLEKFGVEVNYSPTL